MPDRYADSRQSRRDAVKMALFSLLPLPALRSGRQQGDDSTVARLRQPGLAGRPRIPVTTYENDPFVVGVEGKLRCTCGCNLSVYTCRTTDFTCTVSPAMHREVIALVEQNQTEQEILDAFVGKYGEMVLMAPPQEGFNLVGYFLPGVGILGAATAMVWLLARRVKLRGTEAGPAIDNETPDLSDDEAAQLEAELADLER